MSLEPDKISIHKWSIIFAFGFIGIMGISAATWQSHLGAKEKGAQQKTERKLQEELAKSNASQEFMKGQLSGISQITRKIGQAVSDPGLKQMAGTIEKIAKSTPTIIQASYVGNLKQRALSLADEIIEELYMRGWPPRNQSKQKAMRTPIQQMPTTAEGQKQWVDNVSGYFRWKFLNNVRDIRNEFAQLHLRDERLDDFFKYEGMKEDANRQMIAIGMPQQINTFILPQQIEDVADRLRLLSEQIHD